MEDQNNINNPARVSNNVAPQENEFSIQEMLSMFVLRWKWFALSLVVCMALAVLYLMKTSPTYSRSAQLLIKDHDKAKTAAAIVDQMQDLGFATSKSNIENELITIQSPTLMAQVVLDLRLNDKYVVKKGLRNIDLYKKTPVFVIWETPTYDENISFNIHIDYENNKVILSSFTSRTVESKDNVEVTLGDTVSTPVGRLSVISSGIVDESWLIEDLKYYRYNLQTISDAYCGAFTASLSGKKSTVIDMSVKDPSAQKSEDIINSLIDNYNKNWVADKNKVAEATSEFINLRLDVVKQELTNIDNSIANFKGDHLLPDVREVSRLYLEQSSSNLKQILSLQSQLATVEYMQEVLSKQDFDTPLPTSSALSNASLQRQVETYNTALLDRNKLLSNSSESNPLVSDLSKTLQALQVAILQSVHNEIASLNMQIKTLKEQESINIGKIAKSPTQAKFLQTEERQQKVMEGLYLFLLQKREENELSKTFTSYNTRVITEPRGSSQPIAPKRSQVLLIAFIAGLAIPGGIIYLLETMNTKVRGKKDIEKLTLPFAGEIPFYGDPKNKQEGTFLVVKEGARNVINEAFRVVRTNVDFMIGHGDKKVIMTTSMNPGSGKSFITSNLACCMSLKKKRVIAIDLDLRRAALSQIVNSPKFGIVNYLNGEANDWRKTIVKVEGFKSFDVIPVGSIPPNPTELLFNGEYLKTMIEDLKKEYDYVFFDCPPVDVVADAGIVSEFADMTLFVVRAGLLEKHMLPNIDNLYASKKYPSMSLVLNATGAKGTYGYGYGYTYGSSYGYASGYGYGYNKYISNEEN